MFRMTSHGQGLSNGGLTDSHLPLDAPGGSPHLGYLRRVPVGHYPTTRVKKENTFHYGAIARPLLVHIQPSVPRRGCRWVPGVLAR